MIEQKFRKECDIFLCYRDGGAEIAKNIKRALARISDRDFGYVWYSDQENMGNYVRDIRRLISTAKYAVLFLEEGFTDGFLINGRNNYGSEIATESGCVTVREIVEIERQRQTGNLTVVGVHINNYRLKSNDIDILKQVFQNEGIFASDTLSAYTELNRNVYYPRTTDVDEFAIALSRRMEKHRNSSRNSLPKVNLDALIPPLGFHYYGRDDMFSVVDHAAKSKTCINITAPAGSGKTSFVFHWLSRMAYRCYGDADYVLYWSFESCNRNCAISSNMSDFLEYAVSFFEIDGARSFSSEIEKANAISEFMQENPVLLILDGMDTFQDWSSENNGFMRNQTIKKLVISFIRSTNKSKSLLIMLSATPISDLKYYSTQAEILTLPKLAREEGVKILLDLGVNGSNQELVAAVTELNCDPMSITLLGKLLAAHYNGSIMERYRITYTSDQIEQLEQILSFYEDLWPSETKEWLILSLCCLFRHSITFESLRYLIDNANIPSLAAIQIEELQSIISTFKKVGLIYGDYNLNILPTIKDRYRDRFKKQLMETFLHCNRILGEYHASLCNDELITTVSEMLPLYDSVFYYIQADDPATAVSILWLRIYRKRQFFSQKQLGATTNDLSAISLFFDVENDWIPHPKLSHTDAAWLCSVAAYLQNNIGNLRKSEILRRRELAIYEKLGNHLFLASDSQNLARNLMLQGKLDESEQEFLRALDALAAANGQNDQTNPYAQDLDQTQLHTNILTRYAYLQYMRGSAYWDSAKEKLKDLSFDILRKTTTGLFYFCYVRLYTAEPARKLTVCSEIESIYLPSFDRRKVHETAYANLLLAKISLTRAIWPFERKAVQACLTYAQEAIMAAKTAERMDQLPLVLNEILAMYLDLFERKGTKRRKDELLDAMKTVIKDQEEMFLLHELPIYKLDYLFLKIRYCINIGDCEQAKHLYEILCHSPVCMKYFGKKIQHLAKQLKE